MYTSLEFVFSKFFEKSTSCYFFPEARLGCDSVIDPENMRVLLSIDDVLYSSRG